VAEAKAAVAKMSKEELAAMAAEDREYDFDNFTKGGNVVRGPLVGRPRKEDRTATLTVRVPVSLLAKLKATGRGAIAKASSYLAKGIESGAVFL
jgi:hypothetical protein